MVNAKVRLVARGVSQRESAYYFGTFPLTRASSCIRFLASIACDIDLDLCHFDAEQVCVQSELQEDNFMRLPEGCVNMSCEVVRLNRSLYEIKQASRSR